MNHKQKQNMFTDKKIYACAMLMGIFMLFSCSTEENDPPQEDYSSFISIKGADKVPDEPGEELTFFPKSPGDIGSETLLSLQPIANGVDYNITITFSAQLSSYAQNSDNRSAFILQYIDQNNILQIDTIADGESDLLLQNNGQIEKTYTFTRKSGEALYYAIFYSPYAGCTFRVEAVADSQDDTFSKTLEFGYNISLESFHITTHNINFWVNAKGVILP